ncbi:MAG: chromosomal replication initiator protein DnaA [Planctomycetes bacterium]|uniref:chromosomal replication initiator protein DnaA n=1 Tax=Candidatus Wunengus sp. YC65 TaxID=3367701 RepID=UPI001DA212D0|nr:chromosomal replication initiator protein DnaA [Planctomycetota bacterium]
MPIGLEQSSATLKVSQRKIVPSGNEVDSTLLEILAELKKSVPGQQFDMWFSCLRIFSINESSITFITPNDFIKAWLYSNYKDIFSSAVYRVLNSSREVIFLTEDEALRQSLALTPAFNDAATLHTELPASNRHMSSLNGYYRFENFIVGPCNRLAHAAAVAVSESPGLAYNPLFIHGASGLGKTHLLRAIHSVLLSRRTVKTLYLSCEQFVNHFISTIRSNKWDEFRNLYRSLDVLLLDDIQFFENLQGCREEFFHTFNALYNARKQIVITSDCPPEYLKSLEDRLVSRFKWGLLCSVDSPTLETRVAIIEKKASLMNINLTHDFASYLAEHIPGNIRELEGAIVRLGKELKVTRNAITLDFIKKVIREITGNKKSVSIEAILHAVSDRFNVSISQLQSKSRTRSLTLPRQITMYLSRKLTNMSLTEIGGFLGGRDHSTVIHADEKIMELLKKDKNLLFVLQKIESELQR